MKTFAASLVLLTAFSNAVETTTEQFSSDLEQIKTNFSQIESQVETDVAAHYACPGVACKPSEWLNASDCSCRPWGQNCPNGFIWDMEHEDCVCLDDGNCPANHIWNYEECRC